MELRKRSKYGFLTYVLSIFLILGVGLEGSAPASSGKKAEVELAQIFLPVDLTDTQVLWDSCGTWNGYYYHTFNTIVLCYENLRAGTEVARFILLHELGHRFTFYFGTSYERWGNNYEAAADEFAAIFSIVQGHPEDLLHMAKLYRDWGRLYEHDPEDPHPPMEARAKVMESIYYGWKMGKEGAYLDALRFWREELIRVQKWT